MIRVFGDAAGTAAALAARVTADAVAAIAGRGAFRFAVSGGTTPVALYRVLAAEYRDRIDWARVTLLFADERAVPRDAAGRNDRLVRESLAVPLGLADAQVRPMRAEAEDLDAAARDYERELAAPLDLLLLGLGPDGHVASLFPGRAAVLDDTRRVVVERDSPKPPPVRLSLAPRAIAEARAVCVLVAGADKAAAVARALGGRATALECPGVLVAKRDWYADRAAASLHRLEPPIDT